MERKIFKTIGCSHWIFIACCAMLGLGSSLFGINLDIKYWLSLCKISILLEKDRRI